MNETLNQVIQPKKWWAVAVLIVLVLVSALGVIYSSWKSRQLFNAVQQQHRESMRLEEEWGRLLLEQSTWAAHSRIEQVAKTRLQMVMPDPEATVVVRR